MDLSRAEILGDSDDLIGIENHFKLCAGPGAGKTRFLVNHIKNVITNSNRLKKTRKIACITYTNIGVDTLSERLENSLDDVEISTIHSFLYRNVIKPFVWMLEDKYQLNLAEIDGHEEFIPRMGIIREWIFDTGQYYGKKTNFTQIQKDMGKIILRFKNGKPKWEMKQPCKSAIKFETLIKYKIKCWKQGLLTHDDVLFLSYKLIDKYSRVREILRAKFPYIFIDEFQDTNPVQTKIVKLLAKRETVVGVIGDTAQSIFSFTGANVESFIKFNLQDMILYKLENNHRSTEEIITVLNNIRNDEDFKQNSPEKTKGPKPEVIISDFHNAYKSLEKSLDDEDFYVLSYTNNIVNRMKLKIEEDYDSVSAEKLLEADGCYNRKLLIINIVKAIEVARDNNYQDAIKLVLKAYRKNEDFNEKNALKFLYKIVNNYVEFNELPLKKFYNTFIHGIYQTDEFSSKIGNQGNPHELYSNINYFELALSFKLDNDNSFYRTIHRAKGDEFDNILLVIPFDEKDKFINFVKEHNLVEKEFHRRYYVALSRAKKRLFVNLPEISDKEKTLLSKNGFNICE